MKTTLLPVLGVALGVALLPAGAEAKSRRFAVVNVGAADFETAEQVLGLYEGLALRSTAPVPAAPEAIQGQGLRRALAGLPHDEAAVLAASELRRGKVAYAGLRRPEAADAFRKAIALYDGHVRWHLARPGMIAALTYLLLCHHDLGEKAAAVGVAARLRELTGDQRPSGIPEPVWVAYPLAPLPLDRRELRVNAPAQASVFLDDQSAGTGPLVLPVGPGAHRVRVEQGGHRVFNQAVPAGPGPDAVQVVLVPSAEDAFAEARQRVDTLRRAAQPFDERGLTALGRQLGLDELLVVAQQGTSLRVRWLSVSLGKLAGTEQRVALPVANPAVAGLLGQRQALLDAEKQRAAAETAGKGSGGDKKEKSKSLWKKWYFWVAAGVVAAVVAGFAIKDSLQKDVVILQVTKP
jgi:hypothetical protein